MVIDQSSPFVVFMFIVWLVGAAVLLYLFIAFVLAPIYIWVFSLACAIANHGRRWVTFYWSTLPARSVTNIGHGAQCREEVVDYFGVGIGREVLVGWCRFRPCTEDERDRWNILKPRDCKED
jgi:hypothetical protein